MKKEYQLYKYCPYCGVKYIKTDLIKAGPHYKCHACDNRFFQRSSPSAALIIPKEGEPWKVLLSKRNINPNKGKLDMIGGFFDFGEDPEVGAIREAKEEIGVDVKIDRLFDVKPSDYVFQNAITRSLVHFYVTKPISKLPNIKDKKEVSNLQFIDLRKKKLSKSNYSFEVDLKILQRYLKEIN